MAPRPSGLLLSLLAYGAVARAQDAATLVSASGYGNFHAGGVVVTVSGDANGNATAALEWRGPGAAFQAGHPLSRIDATHFVGSLFWLQPGTAYEARVTLTDPDGVSGAAIGVAVLETRVDTMPEPSLRRLHVAPAGNDQNSGTDPGAPLRTIQRAADLALAGDLVLIQPGVYRESVSVPRSGTAAQPIVFRGSAGAILDGADAAIAAGVPWTAGGSGVYSYATGFATGHVVTEHGRLYRSASGATRSATSTWRLRQRPRRRGRSTSSATWHGASATPGRACWTATRRARSRSTAATRRRSVRCSCTTTAS